MLGCSEGANRIGPAITSLRPVAASTAATMRGLALSASNVATNAATPSTGSTTTAAKTVKAIRKPRDWFIAAI